MELCEEIPRNIVAAEANAQVRTPDATLGTADEQAVDQSCRRWWMNRKKPPPYT
jgi:hypothetical protein